VPRGVTYWDRVPLSVDVSAAVLCLPELHPSPKEAEEEEEEEEEVTVDSSNDTIAIVLMAAMRKRETTARALDCDGKLGRRVLMCIIYPLFFPSGAPLSFFLLCDPPPPPRTEGNLSLATRRILSPSHLPSTVPGPQAHPPQVSFRSNPQSSAASGGEHLLLSCFSDFERTVRSSFLRLMCPRRHHSSFIPSWTLSTSHPLLSFKEEPNRTETKFPWKRRAW